MNLRFFVCICLMACCPFTAVSQTGQDAIGTVMTKTSRLVTRSMTWDTPLMADGEHSMVAAGTYPIYNMVSVPQDRQAAYHGCSIGILTRISEGVTGYIPLDLSPDKDELVLPDLGVFFEPFLTLNENQLQIHPNRSTLTDFSVLRPVWQHLQENYILISFTRKDGTPRELILKPEVWGAHNLIGTELSPHNLMDTAHEITIKYVHPDYPGTALKWPINGYDIIPDEVVLAPSGGYWAGTLSVAGKIPAGYDYRLLEMSPESMSSTGATYNQSNGQVAIKASQNTADRGVINVRLTYPHPNSPVVIMEPVTITYDTGPFSQVILFLSTTKAFATYDIMLMILAACILGGLIGVSITHWKSYRKIEAVIRKFNSSKNDGPLKAIR